MRTCVLAYTKCFSGGLCVLAALVGRIEGVFVGRYRRGRLICGYLHVLLLHTALHIFLCVLTGSMYMLGSQGFGERIPMND